MYNTEVSSYPLVTNSDFQEDNFEDSITRVK